MKEKDTKRKVKQLDIFADGSGSYEFRAEAGCDFLIVEEFLDSESYVKSVRIVFQEPNISSDVNIRFIVDSPAQIELHIVVVALKGAINASSVLDMKAMLLDDQASVKFVPSLEIDEKDVSVDHKSSIGAPDIEILSYLKSKGVDQEDLKTLLKDAYLKAV